MCELRMEYGALVALSDDDNPDFDLGFFEDTSCCGVDHFSEFQADAYGRKLDILCHALANTGIEWNPNRAITFLTVVEEWTNSYPIMDALILGGWQEVVEPIYNNNSTNYISMWVYLKGQE